jgi:hypothetical protein
VFADVSNNPQFTPTYPNIPFADHVLIVDIVGACARRIMVNTTVHYRDVLAAPPSKNCWRLFEKSGNRPHANDEKTVIDLAHSFNVGHVELVRGLEAVAADGNLIGMSLYEIWQTGYFRDQFLVALELVMQKFSLCVGLVSFLCTQCLTLCTCSVRADNSFLTVR